MIKISTGKKENITAIDQRNNLGKTKEEILKELLGR